MSLTAFLETIFDRYDYTCFSATLKGTTVKPAVLDSVSDITEFFCINALDGFKDNAPTREWHKLHIPRRADVNVEKFRTFLIESDTLPVERQIKYFERLGMPYTAATFSGSKSVHFLITLTDTISKEKYAELNNRLHQAVNFADSSAKNASRLSRLPGQVRHSSGLTQSLLSLKSRVSIEELEAFLEFSGARTTSRLSNEESTEGRCNPRNRQRLKFLSAENAAFLETGSLGKHTSRHGALVSLAGALAFLEFDESTIEEKLAQAAEKCGLSSERDRNVEKEIRDILLWVRRK
jgi:hypothetical protein